MTRKTMALAISICCLMSASIAVWAQDNTTTKPASRPATATAARPARPPKAVFTPTSGTPQSATPRAVCTFQSISLYWTPDGGADDKTCKVQYRPAG